MNLAFPLALLCLLVPASAQASDVWTCTYTVEGSEPVLARFEVLPPDVVVEDGENKDHYRILQNNEYGLVATLSVSEWRGGAPSVGAVSIVINKGTGEFWWDNIFAGKPLIRNGSSHGTCLKN